MEFVKEWLLKYKLYLIIGFIGVIIVFCFLNNKNEEVVEDISLPLEEETIKEEVPEEEVKEKFKIDIKGEVVNPGVYEVEDGMIIDDAIKLAGGLKENADTMDINLSQKLTSEMVIVISSKSSEKGTSSESKVSVGSITSNKVNNSNGKVSLNTASLEELMTLSGIGEAKAKNIIAYRTATPFTSIEELTNVKGIGEATFEKNKDRLTL